MGKKHPYYGRTMSTNFPGSPHTFCCIFLYYGKLMVKPTHFPDDEVDHRIGISTYTMGKFCLHFIRMHHDYFF